MSEVNVRKTPYFSRDPAFYKAVFHILIMVALQNVINYSVNMADNIMLGAYGQNELSGTTCVNQFVFVVQSFVNSISSSYAVLGSQYWGKKDTASIDRLAGIALKISFALGLFTFLIMAFFPRAIVAFFTDDPAIIASGVEYIRLIKYTMIPYCLSLVMMEILRSVEIVRISFVLSVVSLAINAGLNYLLIFGRMGFSAMGVTGAAIATLIARVVELLVLIWFIERKEKHLRLFHSDFLRHHAGLFRDYIRICIPILLTGVAWAIATPLQSAILGHVSSIAIAANSVSSTFYQYIKVIALAMSSASMVVIGKTVGSGDIEGAKAGAHSLEIIDLLIGFALAGLLFALRRPLLSLYTLTPETLELAGDLISLMCIVMIFMSYEVTVLFGTIRGAGDTKFASFMNIFFVWTISLPLAYLSAFVWKWNVVAIVACIQSDQAIKCIPAFIRLHLSKDKWIHKLTK